MERRKKYVKALAFVPAVVLVGTFVGCQAGAFRVFSKPEPAPPAPANPAPAAQPAPNPPVVMGGSKSIGIISTTTGLTPADPSKSQPNAPPAAPNAPQP